jgi:hypothetical protein
MAQNSHNHDADVYLEPMVEFSGSLTQPVEAEPVIICVSGCAGKPK